MRYKNGVKRTVLKNPQGSIAWYLQKEVDRMVSAGAKCNRHKGWGSHASVHRQDYPCCKNSSFQGPVSYLIYLVAKVESNIPNK